MCCQIWKIWAEKILNRNSDNMIVWPILGRQNLEPPRGPNGHEPARNFSEALAGFEFSKRLIALSRSFSCVTDASRLPDVRRGLNCCVNLYEHPFRVLRPIRTIIAPPHMPAQCCLMSLIVSQRSHWMCGSRFSNLAGFQFQTTFRDNNHSKFQTSNNRDWVLCDEKKTRRDCRIWWDETGWDAR
jgi:hypothetical protein